MNQDNTTKQNQSENPSISINLNFDNLHKPVPMGIIGVFFFTAGMLIFQFVLLGIFAFLMLIFKKISLPVTEILFLILLFSSSLLWATSSYFLKRNLFLPNEIIKIMPENFSPQILIHYLFIIPLIMLLGSNLDSIIIHLFPAIGRVSSSVNIPEKILYGHSIVLIMFAVLAILVAPVTEEIYFRGMMFRMLRMKGYGFLFSALFSGFLFALIHLRPAGFFSLLTVAVVSSYLSEKSVSLFPSILLHSLYNSIVVSIVLFTLFYTTPTINAFSNNYTKSNIKSTIEFAPIYVNLLIIFSSGLGLYLLLKKIGKQFPVSPSHPCQQNKQISNPQKANFNY